MVRAEPEVVPIEPELKPQSKETKELLKEILEPEVPKEVADAPLPVNEAIKEVEIPNRPEEIVKLQPIKHGKEIPEPKTAEEFRK